MGISPGDGSLVVYSKTIESDIGTAMKLVIGCLSSEPVMPPAPSRVRITLSASCYFMGAAASSVISALDAEPGAALLLIHAEPPE
ncbi:hypothetical protein PGT21_021448 [Puccinia graminis f. sp. tritici]|uniref:Uncharacterized protein n=1 Tax=Puccinia graminis f. sp. tritici TaxID=56615 RepID=A0A5B0P7E4_PUCGR|nr:hypothetical protein PGT21_021448 [Puccinia graminis f. sp. tritici]